MNLKTRYVVKGINKEQTVSSIVTIATGADGKITKVEDKWDGKLPESSIANVSSPLQLLNPFWWLFYAEAWGFWIWSWTWETPVWRVRAIFFAWHRVSLSVAVPVVLVVESRADHFPTGFPSSERRDCAEDDQCPQERGGGCEAWQRLKGCSCHDKGP